MQRVILAALFCGIGVLCTGAMADEKAPFEFPKVEGWKSNSRFDPPAVPATTMRYDTKLKSNKENVHILITVPATGGKKVGDVLPGYEEQILKTGAHKNSKVAETSEIKVGKAETPATVVTFSSTFDNKPYERSLVVAAVGDWFIKVEYEGLAKSSKERAEAVKSVIDAVVDAASAK